MPSDGESKTGRLLEGLVAVCDDGVRLIKRKDSPSPFWLIFDALGGSSAISGETIDAAVASAYRDYVANPPLRHLVFVPPSGGGADGS